MIIGGLTFGSKGFWACWKKAFGSKGFVDCFEMLKLLITTVIKMQSIATIISTVQCITCKVK